MRLHFGPTAGTAADDTTATPVIKQRFGQDAPRGVAGAKNEYAEDFVGHCYRLS
jgi:hypothetical protein